MGFGERGGGNNCLQIEWMGGAGLRWPRWQSSAQSWLFMRVATLALSTVVSLFHCRKEKEEVVQFSGKLCLDFRASYDLVTNKNENALMTK